MTDDTIAAISTAISESALGIIRISGKQSLKILAKIFNSPSGVDFNTISSHTVHYGFINDLGNNKQIIDEVMVTIFRSPHTYTREDMIEITCHGNPLLMRRILEIVIKSGARLALPGEFTKRAFLNGRIDLTQAEAVIDLIKAKTDQAAESALRHLHGSISDRYRSIQDTLTENLMFLEAEIDFPENEIPVVNRKKLQSGLNDLQHQIQKLILSYDDGWLIKNGISVAITGKTNTGKSSLFNLLTNNPGRALVTSVPGTTRDIISENVIINGQLFTLLDTAGMKTPRGPVEKESLKLTTKEIKGANLIIFIIDNSTKLGPKDLEIWNLVRHKAVIVVVNKIDLPEKITLEQIQKKLNQKKVLSISCKTNQGIGELKSEIVSQSARSYSSQPDSFSGINNIRQKVNLEKINICLTDAISAIEKNLSVEFIAADIKNALENLEELTGDKTTEQLLESIFSNFCIGK